MNCSWTLRKSVACKASPRRAEVPRATQRRATRTRAAAGRWALRWEKKKSGEGWGGVTNLRRGAATPLPLRLRVLLLVGMTSRVRPAGAHFTCFTGTKVQILTQKAMQLFEFARGTREKCGVASDRHRVLCGRWWCRCRWRCGGRDRGGGGGGGEFCARVAGPAEVARDSLGWVACCPPSPLNIYLSIYLIYSCRCILVLINER